MTNRSTYNPYRTCDGCGAVMRTCNDGTLVAHRCRHRLWCVVPQHLRGERGYAEPCGTCRPKPAPEPLWRRALGAREHGR